MSRFTSPIVLLLPLSLAGGCGRPVPADAPPARTTGGTFQVLAQKESAPGEPAGFRAVGESGTDPENRSVEIDWPVTGEQFGKLAAGMSPEEARQVLGLRKLTFAPDGPDSEFRLVCKSGGRTVTLVFSGHPQAELSGMTEQGAE